VLASIARKTWIDTVARPLELDALEAVAGFIHLEKHHHRHATDHLVGQEMST
jgi:hypothetical protein